MLRSILALTVLVASSCVVAQPVAPNRNATVLVARTYVEADYDAVWSRFASASGYADWYSAPCLQFGSRAGDPVAWGEPDRVYYRGTLETIQYGRGLAHSFQFAGFGFDEPATRVQVDIVQEGPTVLVTVRHDCTGAPRTYETIGAVGWAKALSRLKTLLETGRAMPWPVDDVSSR